jgi:copper chaperone CopZ
LGRVNLNFANASCAHCARLVTRSLEKVRGVLSVDVDRQAQRLTVGFDPSLVSVGVIRSVMEETGYPTRLISERITPFPRRLFSRAA